MVRSIEGKHILYFEAILQLRGVQKEVVDFVNAEIMRYNIHLAKIKRIKNVKNGFDYYLADNNFTKSLGKKLQSNFGGELINTSSLYSQKDGKEIYRGTVLFRQAEFKKGDVVKYQGESYLVIMSGKKILLQHSETGKKIHLKHREMKSIRKV